MDMDLGNLMKSPEMQEKIRQLAEEKGIPVEKAEEMLKKQQSGM